ncbi:helix-turn-helix transcriptional regulator [Streptomyces sp. NPDC046465]|uniref:helix-turn-helix domain-containing protein n=1 Tax=Streptomyces sp. NPDC046465 TaxID=3155810 RepID=UPI0033ED5148
MASLAELLRELKERSGLSYGALAKRLHMSTSTLHRYCNGDAVPTEFAPVERFARLCKATPDELVEAHRRWILADADRRRKPEPSPPAAAQQSPTAPGPETESDARADTASERSEPGASPGRSPSRSRRRSTIVLAAAVAAVVGVGSVALALNGRDDDGHKRQPGTTASSGPSADHSDAPSKDSGKDEDKNKDKDGGKENKGGPSAPPSKKGGPSPETPRGAGKGTDSGGVQSDSDLVTTRTKPYAYDDPCGMDFLVNRKPDEVPQQPAAQDTPGWVGDLGAVASGNQFIEVTVQGLGKETVVLEGMDVRVQSTSAPLTWNNYQMATGCGGNVSTKSFHVDLDDAAPRVTPKNGQRGFPYKVSESDPEVFYINADVASHDVRWYLELRWSSGKRHGVARVDDQQKPFRTSSSAGRPTYGWPPNADKWERQLQDG